MSDTGSTKKFWLSKTFWVNVIATVGIVIQTQTGFIIDPSIQAIVLSVVNTGLRLITKEGLEA